MDPKQRAVIVSAVRTPIGGFDGALRDLPATRLGSLAVGAALDRAGVSRDHVDEVLMGCVLTAGLGQAPARQAAIGAGIPNSTPATTINKVCGSSLKAVMLAVQSIALGEARTVIAGGMESMSRAPYVLARGPEGKRLKHLTLADSILNDGLWDVYNDVSMGVATESCARRYGISRTDADDYAMESYRRVRDAIERGMFDAEIEAVTVTGGKRDHIIRRDEEPDRLDVAKMRQLKPAFCEGGILTAGNSTSCNDGAAAVVVMAEEEAKRFGIPPLVRILGYAEAGIAPELFALAPVEATKRVLKTTGLTGDAIDLYEINEPFSAAAIAVIRELGLDAAKVNVNGGAIALGHPIGATGARILTTLIHAMAVRRARLGLATLCIGGGEAAAIIVERVT